MKILFRGLRVICFSALTLGPATPRAQPLYGPAPAFNESNNASNGPVTSPVGRWKTVDDKTGKVKSIVAVREQNGQLYGTIEALFDPPVPHPTCYLCTGAMKDHPLVGMQVLWGFHLEGNQWSGGQVLDPESGKIYHATLALENGGARLRLRGYIGVPLLGRTEPWLRVE